MKKLILGLIILFVTGVQVNAIEDTVEYNYKFQNKQTGEIKQLRASPWEQSSLFNQKLENYLSGKILGNSIFENWNFIEAYFNLNGGEKEANILTGIYIRNNIFERTYTPTYKINFKDFEIRDLLFKEQVEVYYLPILTSYIKEFLLFLLINIFSFFYLVNFIFKKIQIRLSILQSLLLSVFCYFIFDVLLYLCGFGLSQALQSSVIIYYLIFIAVPKCILFIGGVIYFIDELIKRKKNQKK